MTGRDGGAWGGDHTCVFYSQICLNPWLEGSFLSCQLLLVQAQATCLIQADLKCAPEGGKQGQQCKERKVGRG